MQVLVAEEDLPRAEQLLWTDAVKHEPLIT
jgi:hypothetical protein